MSDDLTNYISNSLNSDIKETAKRKQALIIEALSNPATWANEVHDPGYNLAMANERMQPVNYQIPTRSEYDIAHPEKSGLLARERKMEQEREYARSLAELPKGEIESLFSLMKMDGRAVLDAKALKKRAEQTGETIETEKLESLGLLKRTPIQDESGYLIEFVVTKEGKNVFNKLRDYFQVRLNS